MIGALGIGTLADVIGRRACIFVSVVSFSLFTALLAFTPTPRSSVCCVSWPGSAWAG
jgi:MFS family permease